MRKPKPIILNSIERAIERSRKIPRSDASILKRILMDSLEAMKRGQGRRDDLSNLIDAFNTGEELAVLGICSDAESRTTIQNGQDALVKLYERKRERDSYTMKADEMSAIKAAIWLHGVQLDFASLGEYEKAKKKVIEKAKQALAGNIPEGATVLS